jgi:hypothetical protein
MYWNFCEYWCILGTWRLSGKSPYFYTISSKFFTYAEGVIDFTIRVHEYFAPSENARKMQARIQDSSAF